MQQQLNAYQKSQSITARPGDLLLSLYDGALRFCEEAKEAIATNNVEKKGRSIGRTLGIFDELTRSLDRSHDPQLCTNLADLYHFCEQRLHKAGLEMTSSPIDEVVSHLQLFRRTWAEAVEKARREGLKV